MGFFRRLSITCVCLRLELRHIRLMTTMAAMSLAFRTCYRYCCSNVRRLRTCPYSNTLVVVYVTVRAFFVRLARSRISKDVWTAYNMTQWFAFISALYMRQIDTFIVVVLIHVIFIYSKALWIMSNLGHTVPSFHLKDRNSEDLRNVCSVAYI